ncbi:MAG: hypothetical protein MUP11_13115 [Anaerolineales bacterium]|nr:hypothetical protein [Anaerolineales bacterium]
MSRIPTLVWNHPLSVLSGPTRMSPISSKMLPSFILSPRIIGKNPWEKTPKAKKAADHLQAAMGAEADGTGYLEEIVRGVS